MRTLRSLFLGSFLLFLVAGPAGGQLLRGRVLVAGSTTGVAAADVALLGPGGAVLTATQADSSGSFALSVPEAGVYQVRASRLGFATTQVEIVIGGREVQEVELRMAEEAIPLDPIVVVAKRAIRRGTIDEFYDRMERNSQRGVGFFFDQEMIDRFSQMDLALMLQLAPGIWSFASGSHWGFRMRSNRGWCSPDVYLDGIPMSGSGMARGGGDSPGGAYPVSNTGGAGLPPRTSSVLTMDLEGVEVYRTGQFERVEGYPMSDCGIIFLWRKKDWGSHITFVGLLIAGAAGLGFSWLAWVS